MWAINSTLLTCGRGTTNCSVTPPLFFHYPVEQLPPPPVLKCGVR